MTATRSVVRNALFSVMQALVSALVALVMYRALIEILGLELLGAWSLLASMVGLGRLSELGFAAALVRFVPDALSNNRPEDAGALIASAWCAVAAAVAVVALLLYPLTASLLSALLHGQLAPAAAADIVAVLPMMLAALWLGAVNGVTQRALEGFQRYDILRTASILTMLVNLGATVWAASRYGVIGMATAHLAMAALSALLFVFLLLRQARAAGAGRMRPGLAPVRRMFGYGIRSQAISLMVSLLDPLMKAGLAHFGSLAGVTYFTMANNLVTQVRGLLIAGLRVLVPTVAARQAGDPNSLPRIYARTANVVALVGTPAMALLAAGIPAFFAVWLGRWDWHFAAAGLLLTLTWTINLACAPAYFVQLGVGRLDGVTLAHAVILAVTAAAGATLGSAMGTYGVMAGFALGQVAGTITVLVGFGRSALGREIDRKILHRESRRVAAVSLAAGAAAAAGSMLYGPAYPAALVLLIAVAATGLLLLPFMLRHPDGTALLQMLHHAFHGRR